MAKIPRQVTLTNSAPDVINAIRNSASADFRNYVPVATPDAESVREIGAVIMNYPALQNEYVNALINRIGLVLITSKSYDNPWRFTKRGMLEFGETVENVFVDLCTVKTYDPETAEETLYKRELPDVRSSFNVMNYQKFYKQTIQNDSLRKSFLSWQGVTDFISALVTAMYTAMNYDEFLVMKYLIDRNILNGRLYPVSVPSIENDAKGVASVLNGVSNDLEFMDERYNAAGVHTFTNKNDQFLFIDTKFAAKLGVDVLAVSFNMDKAEFMGHQVLINGFGNLDTKRLGELFAGDPTYEEISQDDLDKLNKIKAIVVDRDWFMIFDNLIQFTENYNGEGLYWQYFLHTWKTFGTSPFANAIVFTDEEPTISSVVVTPGSITSSVGQTVTFTATVTQNGFAPQSVTWQSSSEYVTITADGVATIKSGASGEVTITATSTFDTDKKGTATITVS